MVGFAGAAVVLALLLWGFEIALRRENVDVGRPTSDVPGGARTIELLVPDGDGRFDVETREIVGGETAESEIRRAIEELIRGSEKGIHPLPSTTRLLDVFLDGNGELILNFSDDLRKDHPGGSEAELATVRCLLSTIGANFPDVERVRLLVEGEPITTIAGHADLSGALAVDRYR